MLLCAIVLFGLVPAVTQAYAWGNGGYSADPSNPDYGTHDWIAQHALDWLPGREKEYITANLAVYLYGTELPDNPHPEDGIGDTGKHHVYFAPDGAMIDDSGALRAQEEFDSAMNYGRADDLAMAAKTAGIMSHYIADMAVFGHLMGSDTYWGRESHHSDYEDYVNSRTNSYDDEFNIYLAFDGNLDSISAYDAAVILAYDTTFDVAGDLTCLWMDNNYDWADATFRARCGESLNLAVNLLTDVLHTLYLNSRVLVPTTLTCKVSPAEVTEGEKVTVSGLLTPAVAESVTLAFTKPDEATVDRTVPLGVDGAYSYEYEPDSTGDWRVKAIWAGSQEYEGSASASVRFTVKKKGCIVATATYGSELASEVQFLREFRDSTVMNTFAGKSFMTVFNAWYYSFSPVAASAIAGNEAFRGFTKIILYPLIGILRLAAATFSLLCFSPELGIIVSGLVASSLIGFVYFAPCILFLCVVRRKGIPGRMLRWQPLAWALSVLAFAIAEVFQWPRAMMFSTAMFVLATMGSATLLSVGCVTRFLTVYRSKQKT